jgi:uncharacterized protein
MKKRILSEIFFVYFLPVNLIVIGVLPFEYRFLYLVIICSFTIYLAYLKKFSIESLGLGKNNLKEGLLYNSYLSVIFVVFFFTCYKFGLIGREFVPDNMYFYLFYVFVSCPLQEFTYRSYFFRLLDELNIRAAIYRVIINAIVFGFLHVIYNDVLTVFFTFAMGLLWGAIYQKTRNVYGICLSHIVFGTISILAGLV